MVMCAVGPKVSRSCATSDSVMPSGRSVTSTRFRALACLLSSFSSAASVSFALGDTDRNDDVAPDIRARALAKLCTLFTPFLPLRGLLGTPMVRIAHCFTSLPTVSVLPSWRKSRSSRSNA